MNIFQHFGGKIPTYQEFVNSKNVLNAIREVCNASALKGRGGIISIQPTRGNYYRSFEFALYDPDQRSRRLFQAMAGIS